MKTKIESIFYIFTILKYSSTQNFTEDVRPTFVIVAFRPGLQEPGKLRTDNKFFHGGGEDYSVGETTPYGKKQANGLGKFLRKRYADLVPLGYSKEEIKAISSSSENSQTTMQMVLTGLFAIDRNFDDFDATSPSYSIDDTLLKMGKSVCPDYENVVGKFRDESTKEVKDWLTKEKKIIDIVSQETGINASLSSLVNLGASVMHRRYLKQSEGQWTSSTSSTNLTKSVFEKLSFYADAPSTLCAGDRSCRRLLAGYWLSFVLENLRKKQKSDSTIKMMLFSSPVDSLMSAARLLKIEHRSNVLPSGGFIIEYRDIPEPSVRLISHDAEEENADKRIVRAIELPFCRNFDWCPLETFISNIYPDAVSDWQDVCKVRRCDTPLPAGKSVKSVDCPIEFDKSGRDSCLNWAKYNYCNDYDTVRWLYCRRTCLCDAEFL